MFGTCKTGSNGIWSTEECDLIITRLAIGWLDSASPLTATFGGDGRPGYHKRTDIVAGLEWWYRRNCLYFRNEADYIWYCLKWAS